MLLLQDMLQVRGELDRRAYVRRVVIVWATCARSPLFPVVPVKIFVLCRRKHRAMHNDWQGTIIRQRRVMEDLVCRLAGWGWLSLCRTAALARSSKVWPHQLYRSSSSSSM